jgi:hypothetical protein
LFNLGAVEIYQYRSAITRRDPALCNKQVYLS